MIDQGPQSMEYPMADYAPMGLLKEFMDEVVLRFSDWVLDFMISENENGGYATLQYHNGNDEVWHRLRKGDQLIFFGDPTRTIPGIEESPGVMQLLSRPQQIHAEAALADLANSFGMPSPTEILHSGANPDGKTNNDNAEPELWEDILSLVQDMLGELEGDND